MKQKLLSLKYIIEDYAAKTGNYDIKPEDILRFAESGLSRILPGEQFKHYIALIDVKNYSARKPSNFKYMLQAGYQITQLDSELCSSEIITEYTKKLYGTDCKLDVKVNCDSCSDLTPCDIQRIEVDIDHNWLNRNSHHMYKHMKHYYGYSQLGDNRSCKSCSTLHPDFQLMRRTSNNFFSIKYHIADCINLNYDSSIEYDINENSIVTNFKEGQILISYLGYPVDDEGYMMIPDDPLVFDAIIHCIEERFAYIDYRRFKDQKSRIFWNDITMLRDTLIKKAKARLETPDPDEWEMFIRNHWIKKVPNYKWEQTNNRYTPDRKYSKF